MGEHDDSTCPVIQRGREQRAACAEDADLPVRASWSAFTATLMSFNGVYLLNDFIPLVPLSLSATAAS